MERQITFAPHGHILTNVNVWSPDGENIVYDVRSDPAGDLFDGDRIETVTVADGRVHSVFHARNQACCGVATYAPHDDRIVFIYGPENPTPEFTYGAARRQGLIVRASAPDSPIPLDARDLTPPFTAGALRGGTHVHVFSADGRAVSFTYEDHVLAVRSAESSGERNQRNVGMSFLDRPVTVPRTHPRNHDGSAFSVVMTRTSDNPRPGTNEIDRAFEDAWIEGSLGHRRIAFLGNTRSGDGSTITELFRLDLPPVPTIPGDGPLTGTDTTRPAPPRGTTQTRLTFTHDRAFPGLFGPRFWPRSSPDGSAVAVLMRDDGGVVQIFLVDPIHGSMRPLTRNAENIASAFTWSPHGDRIAHVMDGSVCVTRIDTGETTRLTLRTDPPPRPEACVFSPNGRQIAFVRSIESERRRWNQIFVVDAD